MARRGVVMAYRIRKEQRFERSNRKAAKGNRYVRRLSVEPLEFREMFATITVTSLLDNTTTDGLVTLREAIKAANTNASVDGSTAGSSSASDEIGFSPSLDVANPTIMLNLALGELRINDVNPQPANADLTIDSRALKSLTIHGNDPTTNPMDGIRIFHMFDPPTPNGQPALPPPLVTLKGLTMTQGDAWETTFVDSHGGAIRSNSRLALLNSKITSSEAGQGGAIFIDVKGTDANTREVLRINNTTIDGNTAGTDDSGGFGGGIFVASSNVSQATYNRVVIENGTTISNNTARSRQSLGASLSQGGGLFADLHGADITVDDSTVTNNKAGFGGGLFVSMPLSSVNPAQNSEFTMRRSIISLNSAEDGGGGIWTEAGYSGRITIEDTTVTGNKAGAEITAPASYADVPHAGGGLYVYMFSRDLDPTQLTITGSTFHNNQAGQHGGGIAVCTKRGDISDPGANSGGRVALANSTISGNLAGANGNAGTGGGVHFAIFDFAPNQKEAVNVEIHNVTITENIADTGGGIYSLIPTQNMFSRTNVKLRNTIVSGNREHDAANGNPGPPDNFWGSINRIETRFNLISDTTTSQTDDNSFFDHVNDAPILQNIITTTGLTPFGPGNKNHNGTNVPGLTPLADFGGFTKSHELKTGSPAIDAGDDLLAKIPFTSLNLTYDKRGSSFARKRDVDTGIEGSQVDIGAIETSKAARVVGVTIGSSLPSVVHPDYQVPDHVHDNPFTNGADANQVTSIPVTKPDEMTLRFSNTVLVSSLGSSSFSILGLAPIPNPLYTYTITNITPILVPGSTTLASGVKWNFSSSGGVNFSDQFKIIANPTVLDADGEQLDGEWDNPISTIDTNSSRFPSGNGVPGGEFVFKLTVLRADFNHDNVVDGSDFGIWNTHKFTYPKTRNTYYNGDVTAEGLVDGSDFGIWNSMKFTYDWRNIPARGLDTEWLRRQINYLVRVYGVLHNDGVTVNVNATLQTWNDFANAVESAFAGEGFIGIDDDGQERSDDSEEVDWSSVLWTLAL
jgi:hypothetical protein